MGSEATAANYLVSSLATPEPEPLDPTTEAWMTSSGMTEQDKRNYRYQVARNQGMLAEQAKQTPEQKASGSPGGGGTGMPGGRFTNVPSVGTVGPSLGADMRATPSIQEVLAQPAAQTPPPPPPSSPIVAPSDTQALPSVASGGKLGYRDGVFTNIGVGPEEEAAYRGGVQDFRQRSGERQEERDSLRAEGVIPTPKGRTRADDSYTPPGDFNVNVDAPLPGDENYAAGGFVSQPFMADPSKPLGEEDWTDMGPLARHKYAREVAGQAGVKQARAGGELAEHEAAMTDPEYAVKQRFGPYYHFLSEAKQATQMEVAQVMQALQEMRPELQPGTPEWTQLEQATAMERARAYLNAQHATIAPWDDIFSKNIGLTL